MMLFCTVVQVVLILTVAAASEFANSTLEAEDDHDTGKKTYEGYQLIRVSPQSGEHLRALKFIEKSVDSLWTPVPEKLDVELRNVDMMVSPTQKKHLVTFLKSSSIPFEVNDWSINILLGARGHGMSLF